MKNVSLLMVINFYLFNIYGQHNNKIIDTVDINNYAGLWFEIASCPTGFQKGCRCSTFDFEVVPNKSLIIITNKCIKFRRQQSKLVSLHAKSYPIKGSGNTKFKLQFIWPFRSDYYIIDMATDYSWVIIGNNDRKYLWILSREPNLPSFIYSNIIKTLHEKGYDTERLIKTPQNCDSDK